MWHNFKAVSISHHNAPVDIRERVYLGENSTMEFPKYLRDVLGLDELLVLSTCNRTEVYYLSDEDHADEIIKMLCIEKGISITEKFKQYFQVINDHDSAVQHLFDVAMGLKSSVIGDLQISNQVKKAYGISATEKLAGPFLHRLLHTVFHSNKRVQQETPWKDGAASVSFAAAEIGRELASSLHSPKVLVIGTGEMGRDIALNLKGNDCENITITNRTLDKATQLAKTIDASVIPFEQLHEKLNSFDLVYTAVSLNEPIIFPSHFEGKEKFRQVYLIDMGVPRAIHPDVAKIPGVVLFSIDEIKAQTDEVLERRKEAMPQVQKIIGEELTAFNSWCREFSISPAIQKFKEALELIRQEEMARYLRHADKEQAALVDKVTKSMMNKIVKLPALQLKAACQRGDEENLIGVLNDLFNLEGTKEPNH